MSIAIEEITALTAFDATLADLEGADQESAAQIRNALINATRENHEKINSAVGNRDRLRYYLLREIIEVRGYASHYLSVWDELARREAKLWQFAMDATEGVFDLLEDDLYRYFAKKKDLMLADIEDESTWYRGFVDGGKATLALGNAAKRGITKAINRASEAIGREERIDEGENFDTSRSGLKNTQ